MSDSPGQKIIFFVQTQVLLIYRFISYFNNKSTKLTFTQIMMSPLTITYYLLLKTESFNRAVFT